MPEPNYIAIEGVIGAGKTTLAKMLAERLGAELILDEAFSNPFIEDFYKNPKQYALSAQLYFLLTRYQQQQKLIFRDLFAQKIVCDYSFGRDTVFASITLSERELTLYEKIIPILTAEIPKPDITIYLQTSTQVLLERIKKRNIRFEKAIDEEYLEKLNEAFNYYFFHYDDSPLLVVKTDDIDFVNNEEDFENLVYIINKPISGKKYYNPSGSLL